MMTSLLILHIQTEICIFPDSVYQKTSPLALGGCVMSIYLYFLWRIDWCSGVVPYISYIYCLFTHLLMLLPSFRRSPAAPVLAARSLPARSTRLSLLTFSPLVWSETTRQNADSLNVMMYNLFWTLQRKKLQPVVVWEDLQMIRRSIFAFIGRFCPIPVFMFVLRLIICEDVKKKLQVTISSWTEDA